MSKHNPRLLENLNEERIQHVEAKWANESEERIDAVDRGGLETIDGPSALKDLRLFSAMINSSHLW